MTIEIGIVLFILLAAIILFVSEKLPVDLVALLALAALLMTGVISAEEGFRGFSDDATISNPFADIQSRKIPLCGFS